MPRTKLARILEPKPNYLAEILKSCKAENNISDAEIAKRLGWKNRQTANTKLNQPAGNWRLSELNAMCSTVGCPLQNAIEAYQKSI